MGIRKDLNGINVGANVTERDEHIPEVDSRENQDIKGFVLVIL